MIPEAFVQDLLVRVDVVDVVGRYVHLRRAGANLLGLCPFHQEKSPSFTVSPAKQFYHCFGCGAHGTAIGFLMQFTGSSFPETVENLAHSIGLAVPRTRPSATENSTASSAEQKKKQHLTKLLEQAHRFYANALRASPTAIDYLKKRGISGEIAKQFGLGWAPDNGGLSSAFGANYTDTALVESGLVILNAEGRRYDRFRGRIMFPILNQKGYLIGFGGRVIQQQSKGAKYLNSPETPLFSKGQELYGIWHARACIRQTGYVLVVEGYMDVVSLAQKGLPNAVATLGTATTHHHIRLLLRYSPTVVFSFDGDKAGKKAAWKALETSLPFLQEGTNIRFLFLPEGQDPDSFIRQVGLVAFEQQIKHAQPLSVFLCKHISEEYPLQEAEGRASALRSVTPILQAIAANAYRSQLVQEVAKLLQFTESEMQQYLQLTPESSGPLSIQSPSRTIAVPSPRSPPSVQLPEQSVTENSQEPPAWHYDGLGVEHEATRPNRGGVKKSILLRPKDYQLAQLLLVHPKLVEHIQPEHITYMQAEPFENWVIDFITKLQATKKELPHLAAVLEYMRSDSSLLAVLDNVAANLLDDDELPYPEQELADLLRMLELGYLQRKQEVLLQHPSLGEDEKKQFYDLQARITDLRQKP